MVTPPDLKPGEAWCKSCGMKYAQGQLEPGAQQKIQDRLLAYALQLVADRTDTHALILLAELTELDRKYPRALVTVQGSALAPGAVLPELPPHVPTLAMLFSDWFDRRQRAKADAGARIPNSCVVLYVLRKFVENDLRTLDALKALGLEQVRAWVLGPVSKRTLVEFCKEHGVPHEGAAAR